MYLDELTETDIQNHEERMLCECERIYDRYKEAFAEYQCTIMFKLSWTIKRKVFEHRPLLKWGYCCCVEFCVQKDGKKVWIIDPEGEYEILEDGFEITRIDGFIRKTVYLITEINNLKEDIEYYLEMLKTCQIVDDDIVKHYLSSSKSVKSRF